LTYTSGLLQRQRARKRAKVWRWRRGGGTHLPTRWSEELVQNLGGHGARFALCTPVVCSDVVGSQDVNNRGSQERPHLRRKGSGSLWFDNPRSSTHNTNKDLGSGWTAACELAVTLEEMLEAGSARNIERDGFGRDTGVGAWRAAREQARCSAWVDVAGSF